MPESIPRIKNKSTLSKIIQSLATPIFIKNKSHQWILVNQAFRNLLGLKDQPLLGKNDYDFFPKEQADVFWEKDNQVFNSREVNINEEMLTTADGATLHIETKKIVFEDDEYGDVLCGVITDITEIKKYQIQLDLANTELTEKVRQRTIELEHLNDQLKDLAFKDQLTGLMNRNAFDLKANTAIAEAEKQHKKIAFLFLDMDGLKFVNDSYGHPVGDLLINQAANRLLELVPTDAHLARIGGDEFLIMQPYTDIADIKKMAMNISNQMQKPAKLIDKSLPLNSSLGVACFPRDGKDLVTLFKNADCAMYVAKAKNKASFVLYQKQYTDETIRRLELENELKKAVESDEIKVFFQPIMDIQTQKLSGYEALARWQSDEFGSVSPDEFIPLAEQSELIITLGEQVLSQALDFISQQCINNEYVSVNVSPKQLHHIGFESMLSNLVKKHQINPSQLALEITENVLTEVSENLNLISKSLAFNGIKIFIDDFGTGYSNLLQLRRLNFSCLKIDREFINQMLDTEGDRSLIKAIALMANELNLQVIAEGIETEVQRTCLLELGIKYGQGFLWDQAQSSDYWI